MGRLMGAYDSEELDRPDLNKCPDCGCFFAGENCPLCGKPCPEEMKAGNRAPVKHKKKKRDPNAGRVTFVAWYHSWWFILIMSFAMPLVGIILFATSPYKKWIKITVCVVVALYFVLSALGGLASLFQIFERSPVNTSLSREEYTAKCEDASLIDFYRSPDSYEGDYVKLSLTVTERVIDYDDPNGKYNVYYICSSAQSSEAQIIVRDCTDSGKNYVKGDIITVWGEGAGSTVIYDQEYNLRQGACLNGAHIDIIRD